jgi:hypothetical protein
MAFPRRREPNFAWGNVVSMFSMLPGLRGFWPMSSSQGGNAYDLSGQGRVLTGSNVVYSLYGLAPRASIASGLSAYLTRADEAGLDILGAEADIDPNYQGLTLGGWFHPSSGGTDTGLMGKWVVAANQRSYLLRKPAGDTAYFAVSVDGIATAPINVTPIAINAWQFIVSRFTPSVELATWVNKTKATVVAGVPASIFNSNSPFEIGRYNAANYFNGSGSLGFLCAAALPDTTIAMLYEHSRALFGG